MKIFASSDSCEILAAVADTVSYNVETFLVFGLVDDYLHTLYDKVCFKILLVRRNPETIQYRKLHSRRTLERCFLVSLVELSSLSTTNETLKQELEFDLALYNQRYPRSTMDHSPVSEGGDSMHDVDAERNEEIERLWMTGAIVDKDSVTRLFETTVSKLEASFDDAENQRQIAVSSQGLIKIHQFDSDAFSELLTNWVTRMLHLSNRNTLFRTACHLVAGGCLALDTLVDLALDLIMPTAKAVCLD